MTAVVVIFLVAEYLFVLIYGNSFLIENFSCNAAGVVGYRNLSNYTLFNSLLSPAGMNSILLGAQTASQMSLMALVWFYRSYKSASHPILNKVLASVSFLFIVLSPTITTSFLFLIVLVVLGLSSNNIIKFRTLLVSFFIISALSYYLLEMIYSRYNGFGYIVDELIMPQIHGFTNMSYNEIFFGISLDKLPDMFPITEIAMVHFFAIFGVVGVLLFLSFIAYYIFVSFSLINIIDGDEKVLYFRSLAIVLLFLLSCVHYQVLLQVGVMEIFSIHMACIISIVARNREASGNY